MSDSSHDVTVALAAFHRIRAFDGRFGLCGGVHTCAAAQYYDQEVHEFSICQALLTQVAEIAADRGANAVERIIIEVGPLSGVEPHSLLQVFAVARTGSCAAAAVLSIEETSVVVFCLGCAVQTKTAPNRLVCAECGGYRTRIVAGDELRLRRVELRVPNTQSAGAA